MRFRAFAHNPAGSNIRAGLSQSHLQLALPKALILRDVQNDEAILTAHRHNGLWLIGQRLFYRRNAARFQFVFTNTVYGSTFKRTQIPPAPAELSWTSARSIEAHFLHVLAEPMGCAESNLPDQSDLEHAHREFPFSLG